MGCYLEVNERENNSRVTSGLMGAIICEVIGPMDEVIFGWVLTQKQIALIVANMSILRDKESFNTFMALHKDSYWANRMSESPDLYKNTVSYIRDAFAEVLADMILNDTDKILAKWV